MNAPANIHGSPPALNLKAAKPFSLPERMIAMRYLRAKKSEGGVALIAGISFSCIMLAIAAMIIIMSVMNGFRSEMVRLTVGSEGHIYASTATDLPSDADLGVLEDQLSSVPRVESAFRYTREPAAIQANGRITFAQVNGLRPNDLLGFEAIRDGLVMGSFDGFGEGRGSDNRIVIGSRMAAQLGVIPGDRVTLYPGKTRSTIAGSVPVVKPYTVGGIFEIGIYQSDLTQVFMSLDQANLLFNEGKLGPVVQVRLDDADNVDRIMPRIYAATGPDVFLSTWRDSNQALATALRTEQIAMRMIFTVVVIIATFPVLAAMIMLVKNKSRDIAILRTIGATRGAVLRIFFMSGAMIGMLGTLVGLAVGVLFCLNIGAVQSFIEFVTQTDLFPAEAYQLSNGIPAKIVWSEVLVVTLIGFVISFLATLFPAWSASRTDPVDALRYE